MSDPVPSFEKLLTISEAIGPLSGWDFSHLRVSAEKANWSYEAAVEQVARADQRVLDIGTGGGEKILQLSSHFGSVVAIDSDPNMIETAQANLIREGVGNITFQIGDAEALDFPAAEFDLVLNRRSVLNPDEIVRVLRPGGLFLTQQVGERNLYSLANAFGGVRVPDGQGAPAVKRRFERLGCTVLRYEEYDRAYVFRDLESLVFQIQSMPLPVEFDMRAHWRVVQGIVLETRTHSGEYASNEHRWLLGVRGPHSAFDAE